MESEANLSQELAANEVEAQTEATAPIGETTEATPQTAETVEEAPAAEAPAEEATTQEAPATEEAAVEEAPATEEAPAIEASAEGETLVATPDVAPAQSKMDLARIAKEELIERAKQLSESSEWRKTSDAQRALMEEWRAAGYAGKEQNDKLWDEFRAARDVFFTRRDEHYAELRAHQAEVIKDKKRIIEEAKELTADIHNWVKTSDALNELMNRWKSAGNAGRENEQQLWEEFNGIRRDFRTRRKADLAERRSKERENADAKRKLVEEAKAIAESEEYIRENSDRMRALNEEYKAIGYAGRPANDTLWQELRAAQNAYWEGNSARRNQQRRERSERLQEAVERKNGQIEHLKDQNETLTTRLESTLNPEKVAQIKRWIEENEERVGDLKDDIDQIKKKI
ncbi:MAG: DUF349 domain-containing protein [Coriobacteriales bacterium]|nr:DUF349 domain-containing protein [Coriobacteriales bacterium]